jgi:hypothetical protein
MNSDVHIIRKREAAGGRTVSLLLVLTVVLAICDSDSCRSEWCKPSVNTDVVHIYDVILVDVDVIVGWVSCPLESSLEILRVPRMRKYTDDVPLGPDQIGEEVCDNALHSTHVRPGPSCPTFGLFRISHYILPGYGLVGYECNP